MTAHKVGHQFLAALGKKRLRPGGAEATSWLMTQGDFSPDMQVLEVACNMGTTLIELAKTYGCRIIGVDIDSAALTKAKQNILEAGVEQQVTVQTGNALKLPFQDNTFDIVVNEAMLTMLDHAAKAKALAEYYRVLKPGGRLLTHDISLCSEDSAEKETLSQAIHMRVAPLTTPQWQQCYHTAGFQQVSYQTGPMSLMSPVGLVRDEGMKGACTIVRNGLKAENREQFLSMFRYFRKQKNQLNYIVHCAEKSPSRKSD